MKLGTREIFFSLLLVIIPVAAYAIVFRPANHRNAEMLRQIEARQQRLRDLNKATAALGDLRKEIGALADAMRFFQSKLPNEKEMDKVLREVWRLAEDNHLAAKSLRTLPSSDAASADQGTREQIIAVQVEGDFRGFYGFLQALENQPRIMRIPKMTIGKLKNAPEGQVQVNFDMSVFFERS